MGFVVDFFISSAIVGVRHNVVRSQLRANVTRAICYVGK